MIFGHLCPIRDVIEPKNVKEKGNNCYKSAKTQLDYSIDPNSYPRYDFRGKIMTSGVKISREVIIPKDAQEKGKNRHISNKTRLNHHIIHKGHYGFFLSQENAFRC